MMEPPDAFLHWFNPFTDPDQLKEQCGSHRLLFENPAIAQGQPDFTANNESESVLMPSQS
jgi:hypothetical protein